MRLEHPVWKDDCLGVTSICFTNLLSSNNNNPRKLFSRRALLNHLLVIQKFSHHVLCEYRSNCVAQRDVLTQDIY